MVYIVGASNLAKRGVSTGGPYRRRAGAQAPGGRAPPPSTSPPCRDIGTGAVDLLAGGGIPNGSDSHDLGGPGVDEEDSGGMRAPFILLGDPVCAS